MTAPGHPERAVSDPVGLIVDLVGAVELQLEPARIRTLVTGVAGGRAKSRRLAAHLAEHPSVLTDDALRRPGPSATSSSPCVRPGPRRCRRRVAPSAADRCAPSSAVVRTGTAGSGPQPEPCAACGNTYRVASRDRAGRPRCGKCPDTDGRDPIAVIGALITELDSQAGQELIADAVRRSAPRPSYQQKLAWALESNPSLLTGDGHLAPHRAILRLIDLLHEAGVTGIVRPSCPGCHRVVRIDKPLDGQRVCRTCISHSRIEECSGCGARREPATRDGQGRPLCPNCLVNDPANLEQCGHCGRRKVVNTRTSEGPLCSGCPSLPAATCSICGKEKSCGTSRTTGRPWCPDCQRRSAPCSACGGVAAVVFGTLDQPLCAGCTAPEVWHTCPTCSDPDHPHPGQCARCLINRRLNELLGPPSDALHTGLEALRNNIATTEHPITAKRWLNKPSVSPVLADLAVGRRALTQRPSTSCSTAHPSLTSAKSSSASVPCLSGTSTWSASNASSPASSHPSRTPNNAKFCTGTRSGTCSGGFADATTAAALPEFVKVGETSGC
jgi:hypothetical protein